MINLKPYLTRLGCLVEHRFTLAPNGAMHEHIILSVPNPKRQIPQLRTMQVHDSMAK